MKTSSKALLDTNIVIAVFAGDPAVLDRLGHYQEVAVPVQVLGELYYGVCRSTRKDQNLARIDEFAERAGVLDCDSATAREYGKIKSELARKGRPIPENDVWIAALARQHAMVLVTRDRHFEEVEPLKIDLRD